jgi:hypothetical protein
MSDFSRISRQVARHLFTTQELIGEERMYDAISIRVASLLKQYPCVGANYEAITEPDKTFFDGGVAFLVASDLYEEIRREGSNVDSSTGSVITKKKQKDLEITYGSTTSTSSGSSGSGNGIAQDYWERGWELLKGIDCITVTPLDGFTIELVQPYSTLSPVAPVDCEDWARIRGLLD